MLYLKYYMLKIISMIMFFFGILFLILSLVFKFMSMNLILEWSIIKIMSMDMKIILMMDFYSLFFSFIVMYISSSIILFSEYYMEGTKMMNRFIILMLLFVISMILLIYSSNMIFLLLGWDGLGLVSFLLVIFYQNKSSLAGGVLTILSNRLGDGFLILGLCMMYDMMSYNYIYMIYLDNKYMYFMILILLACMTKSAQFPFSAWLPAAMAAPTPVSSLVHSSTLVTAGVYLLIRYSDCLKFMNFNTILLYSCLITMLMSGLSAMYENDLKKIVALSTLSQLSLMMLAVSLGMYDMAYFHLITHATFKSLMFLCVGVLMHGYSGYQDMRFMSTKLYKSNFLSILMIYTFMTLGGMFFLSGFYSKDLIIEFIFMNNYSIFVMIMLYLGSMLTIMYSVRVIYMIYTNSLCFNSLSMSLGSNLLLLPLGMLFFLSIFSGSLMSWLLLDSPMYIILNFYSKIIILLLIIVSLVISYSFIKLFLMINIKNNIFNSFLNSMWFMNYFSSQHIINFSLVYSMNINKLIDKGWSEKMGGLGVYSKLINLSKLSNNYYYYNISMYLVSFIIWILIILFII
uniref:NADH-ubiquinone oxidoreductase chain 5 n=1 Tax=Colossendeis brevirostris TaxID=619823 RepID=A0A9E7V4F8_9CHEL|nr:NADH dehydrogenase subunit 5 [Colossendeis brevirostris]UYX57809.1 NADH dehydrogenase subunit 5 [Colossendeis brevirostris]